MKILHLVGGEEDIGGVLSVLRNLQSASEWKGWRHTLLVGRRYQEKRTPRLRYIHARTACEETDRHFKMLTQVALALPWLYRLIRKNHYDIIHAHSRAGLIMGLGLAWSANREILFTNHNYAKNKRLYQWAASRRNIRTVLLTPNMANHYELVPDQQRIHVISACCPDSFFEKPLADPPNVARSNTRIRLIGTGNIVGWKNWHLLVEALALMERVERGKLRVEIWGPTPSTPEAGQYSQALLSDVKAHGLTDTFKLMGPTHDVAEKLSESDWFVLPSTNEPCSVALMEALSMGVPALVSRSGGCVDIVKEGKNGLLFEPDRVDDLAQTLRMVSHGFSPGFSREEIRESVRTRSASKVVELYGQVYQSMIQE